MKFMFTLTAQDGAILDARSSIMLAWDLLLPLADLLSSTNRLSAHNLLPIFAPPSSLTLTGTIGDDSDLFDSIELALHRLSRASALLGAAEQLLQTCLADRLILPNARLPVTVVHSSALGELLAYDEKEDIIRCEARDWAEVVSQNAKTLKALACIYAAGLTPQLEIDSARLTFPHVSTTLFDHKTGAGRSIVSTGHVTGHYQVAAEIEVSIVGFRGGRVIRAHVSEAARLAASRHHAPYRVAMEFSEATPHLPLLPPCNGRVMVERMWDFETQTELDFSPS